jgi:hypothetical protein
MFRRSDYGLKRVFVFLGIASAVTAVGLMSTHSAHAQTVTASVNVGTTLAQLPEYGMGVHTSVYDNSLRFTGSPYNLLDGMLDEAGINTLRYPGGGYADVFHFSHSRPSLNFASGFGLSPWWGTTASYGYMGPSTDFGNFVKLLDATNSKTVITLNTASAMKFDTATKLGVPTHNGQPQEAAAWVAYANADASIYGTPNDIALGVDAEGNDWKTAGYWARLRASTTGEYQTWASADGVYNSQNAFLAIDRDSPVGIKYWEIGNENFGTGYYGGAPRNTSLPVQDDFNYHQYALNYAVPYDGTLRDDHPALSPAAYGQEALQFIDAMKAVDPTIKAGVVLATPPDDYNWSYADLNDNGTKGANEPYWNDEVLSQSDAEIGKVADVADFVIVHWYPNGNESQILNHPRLTIPRMIHGTTSGVDTGSNAGLRDSIATWRTDGNAQALEIFVTETDGGGSSGASEAVDGLFAADEYITFFENGVSNVDWLELHGGSFLEDNNQPDYAYWGVQSVHLLAEPGDDLLATTTSESDVRIHASKRADGSVAVMVINMNTSARTVDVSIDGDSLSDIGVRYQTNGDTALASDLLGDLGNSFSTSIAARTLQLFIISEAEVLAGDYNDDGVVDAVDYTVWRNALDGGGTLENETESLGVVDQFDYEAWKANYGNTMAGAGGLSTAVPEPSTAILAMLAFFGASNLRRRAPHGALL